jgi:hypothetical protein
MAVRFNALAEVRARPSFDSQFVVTLDNYRSVVGPTHFPDSDKGSCQLHRDGRLCQVEFQNGWVVRAANDSVEIEALIGKDCAQKYFHQFQKFNADAIRVERELELRNLHERREAVLNDATFPQKLRDCEYRLKNYEDGLSSLRTRIPASIVTRLNAMGKIGAGRISLEVAYLDEDKNGKTKTVWERNSGDEIAGVTLWSQKSAPLYRALHGVQSAYAGAANAASEPIIDLRKRVQRLESVTKLCEQIAELEARMRAFTTPDNLARVCLLTNSQLSQSLVGELALERARKTRESGDVEALIGRLIADLRQRFNGRQVRILND